MWAQSDRNIMVLQPITDYGWSLENNELKDTEENVRRVRERVGVLFKGCKCITGCKNRVCGCRKKNTNCTEGCLCINCENQALLSQDREDLADIALEEAVHSNNILDEEDEDEFAEFVFAAAFEEGNETNVNTELIEDNYIVCTTATNTHEILSLLDNLLTFLVQYAYTKYYACGNKR